MQGRETHPPGMLLGWPPPHMLLRVLEYGASVRAQAWSCACIAFDAVAALRHCQISSVAVIQDDGQILGRVRCSAGVGLQVRNPLICSIRLLRCTRHINSLSRFYLDGQRATQKPRSPVQGLSSISVQKRRCRSDMQIAKAGDGRAFHFLQLARHHSNSNLFLGLAEPRISFCPHSFPFFLPT